MNRTLLLKVLFPLCCTVYTAGTVFGQVEDSIKLNSLSDRYCQGTLQEKIFVHTDKACYTAGEIIWFKIYLVQGDSNAPLGVSKIGYVEILNEALKPVLQAKILLNKGFGNGSFYVPANILSGNYHLRAYTSWMKNFDPDFYFQKSMAFINVHKKIYQKIKMDSVAYDIHFFPEGGDLVNNLLSKVGFQVVDVRGKGVDCHGVIMGTKGDTAAVFQSSKFGMGHFNFTPRPGETYQSILTVGNSNLVISDLPAAKDQGYVMRITDTSTNQIKVLVSTNIRSVNSLVYLLVQTRQVVKIALSGLIENGKLVFLLNKNKLGEGISSITLFNNNRQPLCERLYFIRPLVLTVSLVTDKPAYGTREKVEISVRTHDMLSTPQPAHMSLAVFEADSLQPATDVDIFSYLWLGSELTGSVESPAFYQDNTGDQADEAMENLLLTHGWRRFRCENNQNSKSPLFDYIPEYEGHVINGSVTNKTTGLPVENVLVYLSVPGIHYQLGAAMSNKKGLIRFDIKDFYGAAEIVVETANQSDSQYRIDISSPFSDKFTHPIHLPFHLPESIGGTLLARTISSQVQNIFATDSIQQVLSPLSMDTTNFYGKPDAKYFLDDYTRFATMEEVMREYVRDLSVRKHANSFRVKILAEPHRFFEDDPLMMIDGVPFSEADKIFAFDPLKIKKIEVVNKMYYLGPSTASGIVSYTTYKGNLDGFQLDPNSIIMEYEGIQLQREFYSPAYETLAQHARRIPDFRSLLFWSPEMVTDLKGMSKMSFFTGDRPGRYIAIVQGITTSGLAGVQSKFFEVIK